MAAVTTSPFNDGVEMGKLRRKNHLDGASGARIIKTD
jgi:hypothetical protein